MKDFSLEVLFAVLQAFFGDAFWVLVAIAFGVLVLWVVALGLLAGGHRRLGLAIRRSFLTFIVVAIVAVAVIPFMTNSAFHLMQGIDFVFWFGGALGLGLLGAAILFPIFVMAQIRRQPA